MSQRISITFKANGEGSMDCTGLGTFQCLGKPGVKYPADLTITAADKKGTHHSQEFNVDMPHAILIMGDRGIYIHEWPGPATIAGNGGPSAGCIHLSPTDAPKVYTWVTGRTRITISYPW
jgi:lipoprotein-anchoring transpeptidase ErfK/SrfK